MAVSDLKRIRSSSDKEVREVLLATVKAGTRYKMTRSGIILYGPAGRCGTHFSVSDRRGVKNLRADMKRCGITPKGT